MLLHMQRQKHRMHWENNSLLEQGSRSTLQMLFTSWTVILTQLDIGDNQCFCGDNVVSWWHMSPSLMKFWPVNKMNSILVKKKIAETTFGVKNDFIFPSNSFWRISGPTLIPFLSISGQFPVDETVCWSVFLCSELISFICIIFMSLWVQMKCHLIKIILQKIKN